MVNQLLFVFEGQVTEDRLLEYVTKFFLNENTIICCAFCQDIYHLFQELEQDEDLDLFVLLKEIPFNQNTLSNFSRDDFAEMYLFFDYDGHATKADDQKLAALLQKFNNETDHGKLYISYPMVEALKHLHPAVDFQEVKVNAKENINYKNLVHCEGCITFRPNLSKLTKELINEIVLQHLKKMNFIVHDNFELPHLLIDQQIIFENQLLKYINVSCEVAVLSAFPPLLLDYYGVEQMTQKLI